MDFGIIITGIITIITALGGSAVLVKWMSRSKDRADTDGQKIKNATEKKRLDVVEAETLSHLKNETKKLMDDSLETLKQLQNAQTDKAAAELLIKVKDEQLKDHTQTIKQILIEQGAAQEREKICQRELGARKIEINEINRRLDEMGDQEKVIGQNMQMKAILRDLRLDGKWAGNEDKI